MIQLPPELIGPSAFALIRHVGGSGHQVLGYVDPGTGSLIIQAALAASLSVPFLLRSKIRAILAVIRTRHWRVRPRADKRALS
jgi:hypothetical protein